MTHDFLRGYCANLVFACADNQVLAEYAKELNSRKITLKADSEYYLTGTFAAGENQRILFSIPWDEGWTLYVDGTKIPIEKTWDLFMSANVPVGEHQYEIRFVPAWLNVGIVLLCGSVVLLCILIWIVKLDVNIL